MPNERVNIETIRKLANDNTIKTTSGRIKISCEKCLVEQTRHVLTLINRRADNFLCRKCTMKSIATNSGDTTQIRSDRSKKYWSNSAREKQSKLTRNKMANPSVSSKISSGTKQAWERGVYSHVNKSSRNKAISNGVKNAWARKGYRKIKSAQSKNLWSDESYRHSVIKALQELYQDPDRLFNASLRTKELWESDDYRNKVTNSLKKYFSDPKNKNKFLEARKKIIARSNLEYCMEYLLKESGVEFDTQKVVGPYSFDFLIGNTLLEINGYYWHKDRSLDAAKKTYVERHTDYELSILEECDFGKEGKLLKFISSKFGIHANKNNFELDDVELRQIRKDEASDLLSAFHYMGKPNRFGLYFGGFLKDKLIAACILSAPSRQEIVKSIGYPYSDVVELSRFVIHPLYQKKNFASWLISRIVKHQSTTSRWKSIVAFADSSIHDGAMYKACNFKYHGMSRKSNYHYVDEDGYVMHKKTLWDMAKRNNTTEREMAIEHNLSKVIEGGKHKFVLTLNSR